MVASILWSITCATCVYVGMFSYVPYQTFNIVKLISMTEDDKKVANFETSVENQLTLIIK